MNRLVFILVYPLIWFVSILPFKILYIISDVLYVFVYYIVGYRKKVVMNNLQLVFPEKTQKELVAIQKKFYHHFVDIFVEIVKSFTISEKEMNRRYVYENIELLNDLYKDGKSVVLIGSHYANWEWANNICGFVKYKYVVAYKKISNPFFNKAILKSRGRFGGEIIERSKTFRTIVQDKKNATQAIYGLISDQSTPIRKASFWSEFLGVRVPVITGGEMLAKKYEMNVVLISTAKIKRGFYKSTFSLITNNPSKFSDFELTKIYLEKMEAQIRKEPEYYLWTHRRFKHKDKTPK